MFSTRGRGAYGPRTGGSDLASVRRSFKGQAGRLSGIKPDQRHAAYWRDHEQLQLVWDGGGSVGNCNRRHIYMSTQRFLCPPPEYARVSMHKPVSKEHLIGMAGSLREASYPCSSAVSSSLRRLYCGDRNN
jgi:hypothetical protein